MLRLSQLRGGVAVDASRFLQLARLEGKLNELSDAMTISGIDGDQDAVARLGAEYEKAQAELDGVYDRWEALSSELAALNETRVEA